jgi:hypothetical protein
MGRGYFFETIPSRPRCLHLDEELLGVVAVFPACHDLGIDDGALARQ